jgi:hypothetical protein
MNIAWLRDVDEVLGTHTFTFPLRRGQAARMGASRVEGVDPPDASDPAGTGRRLTGSAAAKLHLTLAVGLALCIAAFWFELTRALDGNSLSWAYVFEWPLFGAFAVYMWWNLLHGGKRKKERVLTKPVVAPEHQQMLEAWQEYQRKLAADGAEAARAGSDPDTDP